MRSISAGRLQRLPNALVVDVREYGQDGETPFVNVLRVPMSEISDRLSELSSQTLYIVCEDGRKTSRVVAYLDGEGFDAIGVEGGLAAVGPDDAAVPSRSH